MTRCSRQVVRNLFSVGRRCATLRGLNTLGFLLTLVASFSMSVGLASVVLASAVYEHRTEVARDRGPIVAGEDEARLLLQPRSPTIGSHSAFVAFVEPRDPDVAPPPGVTAFPGPGEVVVSPALRDILREHDVADRFGRQVGLIAREGLASPTELFAYARPAEPMTSASAIPVAGFGGREGSSGLLGEDIYDRSVVEFWVMGICLMIVPGIVALVAAGRVADDETRRRHILLARLGASRTARVVVAFPRTVYPTGVSLLLVLALAITASAVDFSPPFTAFVVDAAIVRDILPVLVAVVVIAHVVAMAVLAVISAGRLGTFAATRLTAPADRSGWGQPVALIVVLAVQPWVIALVDLRFVVALSTLTAAVVAIWCLPPTLAMVFRALSGRFSHRSLLSGNVGKFIGWRITGHRSRAMARLTGAITGLVILVGHAAAVLALFTGNTADVNTTMDRVGKSVLVADPDTADVAEVAQFADQRDIAILEMRRDYSSDGLTLVAGCETLRLVAATCVEGELEREGASVRLGELLAWEASTATSIFVVPAEPGTTKGDAEESSMAVFLSRDGGDLDINSLSEDAYTAFGPGFSLEQLGASSFLGGVDLLRKSHWLYVFGVPGVLTLLITAAVTWAAVVIEESKELVRNPLFAERHDLLDAVSMVRVGYPIVVGGVAGVLATAWMLAAHVQTGAVEMPVGFLAYSLVGTLAAATLGRFVGLRLMSKASRTRWAVGES